jgi:type VI protein secretion system component VasK
MNNRQAQPRKERSFFVFGLYVMAATLVVWCCWRMHAVDKQLDDAQRKAEVAEKKADQVEKKADSSEKKADEAVKKVERLADAALDAGRD